MRTLAIFLLLAFAGCAELPRVGIKLEEVKPKEARDGR